MVGANSGWSNGFGIVSPITTTTTTTTQTQTTNVQTNNEPNIISQTPPLPVGQTFAKSIEKNPLEIVLTTEGGWNGNISEMRTFYTGSTFTTSSYMIKVYDEVNNCKENIFNLYYCNSDGSGSLDMGGKDFYSSTNANYSLFANTCLDGTQRFFKIGNRELKSIYVLKLNGKYKEFDRFEINLANLSGSTPTGSALSFISDKNIDYKLLNTSALNNDYYGVDNNEFVKFNNSLGEYHYIVRGTDENGVNTPNNPSVAGIVFPKLGVFVFDGTYLDNNLNFNTASGSNEYSNNVVNFFNSISGSITIQNTNGFILRRLREKFVERYFIRIKNNEYNFTNNPTYLSGSEGMIREEFVLDKKVYYTQIGLYNDNKELLAIAKLSRPIQKDFVTEGLFTIKLEY